MTYKQKVEEIIYGPIENMVMRGKYPSENTLAEMIRLAREMAAKIDGEAK